MEGDNTAKHVSTKYCEISDGENGIKNRHKLVCQIWSKSSIEGFVSNWWNIFSF